MLHPGKDGRRLVQSTLWNLLGQVVPVLSAVVAIPVLVRALGTDRFGILTLAWVVIGYFSLFDFGIGRALTKVVAEELNAGRLVTLPKLVRGAFLIMGVLSLCATAVMLACSRILVERVLKIPVALRPETLDAFYVLALCVPVVILSTGLRGVLEAYMRFDLSNAVRVPLGIFTFLGPLLVLPFTTSLVAVIAVLFIGRLAAGIVHWWLCLRVMPSLRERDRPTFADLKPLLHLGGWMTLSNIISPLMVSMDRFLIGAFLSVSAVAFYTTPYEAVTKLLTIPGALSGVAFPSFSATHSDDPLRTAKLFERATKSNLLFLFGSTAIVVTFAHSLLQVWLGSEFAARSTPVLQWLAIGVMVNGLAVMPFVLVQAFGRPDLTAKLQLLELPIYLLAVVWLIHALGIRGAAIAWTGRVSLDAALLFFVSSRHSSAYRDVTKRLVWPVCVSVMAVGILALLANHGANRVILVGLIGAFLVYGWRRFLMPEERASLVTLMREWVPGRKGIAA